MLKYKRITTATLTDGVETLANILGGMSGKNRKIIAIATAPLANMYLRLYKDAEQIIDCASIHLTTAAPWLPMALTLAEGEQVTAGFYNNGAATTAKQITIAYEEAD